MSKQWRLSDLDFTKAREYISSQDPDMSLRFFLPVPNWLDGAMPATEDPDIRMVQKKSGPEWRFVFTNFKDNAEQGVKIDGSAAIVLMGADRVKSKLLKDMIAEYIDDPAQLTPAILRAVLERSHRELGLADRFNKDMESLAHFYPYEAQGRMGAFLPKPNPSSAIYLEGAGEFLDGPTLTPQKFENGAFINFPGKRLADLFKGQVEARLVQAEVFIKDRENTDGSKIDLRFVPT